MDNTISVLFFARFREELNCSSITVDASKATTITDIRKLLSLKGDAWFRILNNEKLLIALNKAVVTTNEPVTAGDEVAFYPPVTGG